MTDGVVPKGFEGGLCIWIDRWIFLSSSAVNLDKLPTSCLLAADAGESLLSNLRNLDVSGLLRTGVTFVVPLWVRNCLSLLSFSGENFLPLVLGEFLAGVRLPLALQQL